MKEAREFEGEWTEAAEKGIGPNPFTMSMQDLKPDHANRQRLFSPATAGE